MTPEMLQEATKRRSGARRPTPALISTLRRPLSCGTLRNSGAVKGRMVKKELVCVDEETTTGHYREPPDIHRTGHSSRSMRRGCDILIPE
jgi:hypothetical protein